MDRQTMKKTGCRIFQFCVKSGMYILRWRTPKIMQGSGASRRLPVAIKRHNLKKPLIVTGKIVRGRGLLDGMLETMESFKIPYAVFDGVTPDPTDENVEAGVAAFLENECDCIIAFGGGSPMDCAKAIGARIARPKKTVKKLKGMFKVLRPIPTLIAVPTTAGTGSETTIAAVITDAQTHHKASVTDLALMPGYAVLDPDLTAGLSPQATAATGMDALCHAVEAYTNNTYNTRKEKELARKAVRLIYENLLRAYQDGSDLDARQKMQQAAFYAGRAFTRGCVGYVHAIGHPLGGLYGTPHGLAMGILLPHVMRAYGTAAHKRLAELCDVCELAPENESEAAKAEAFLKWIEELKEKLEIPRTPDMIRAGDTGQIAAWAEKEANPFYPVPVIWSREEIEAFIRGLIPGASAESVKKENESSAAEEEKKGVEDDN